MIELFQKNSAEQIKQKAEKQKEKAKSQGLLYLIHNLFYEEIINYPIWIKDNKNKEYVPKIITEITKKKLENETIVEFILKNKKYKLVAKKEDYRDSLLELFEGNKKVFAISEGYDSDDFESYPIDVESFIEGEWINDFKELELSKEKIRLKKEIELEKEIADEEQEKLKKNFDLEVKYSKKSEEREQKHIDTIKTKIKDAKTKEELKIIKQEIKDRQIKTHHNNDGFGDWLSGLGSLIYVCIVLLIPIIIIIAIIKWAFSIVF